MALAYVLFSILTGGLPATVAAMTLETGIFGTLLAYWFGGMLGAVALILWAVFRPEDAPAYEP